MRSGIVGKYIDSSFVLILRKSSASLKNVLITSCALKLTVNSMLGGWCLLLLQVSGFAFCLVIGHTC